MNRYKKSAEKAIKAVAALVLETEIAIKKGKKDVKWTFAEVREQIEELLLQIDGGEDE